MASYQTHTKCNLIFLPFIVAAIFYIHPLSFKELTLFSGSFLYATFFLNPDLDLANQIKLFSIRGLLTLPFRIYGLFFHHRGLSHSILFGTLSRIVFLTLFFFFLGYFCDMVFFHKKNLFNFFQLHKKELLYVFMGVFLADLSHLIVDIPFIRKEK